MALNYSFKIFFLISLVQLLPTNCKPLKETHGTPPSPPVTFSTENSHNLSLLYLDDHVAFYFDLAVYKSNPHPWLASFKTVSKMWNYVKDSYSVISTEPNTDSRLYILISEATAPQSASNTIKSQKNNSDSEGRIVLEMECGIHYEDESSSNKNGNKNALLQVVVEPEVTKCTFDTLAQRIADQVWTLASTINKQTEVEQLPLEGVPDWLESIISTANEGNFLNQHWEMSDMILYDIYMGVKEGKKAEIFKNQKMGEITHFPMVDSEAHLLRDWYMPIYTQYGGSEAIKSFFNIISLYTMLNGTTNFDEHKSLGVFVHLWSGATGHDLMDLAQKAFGWNAEYEREFRAAQDTFPFFNYTDVTPSDTDILFATLNDQVSPIPKDGDRFERYAREQDSESVFLNQQFPATTQKTENATYTVFNKLDNWSQRYFIQALTTVVFLALVLLILAVSMCSTQFPCFKKRLCFHTKEEVDELMSDP